MSQFWGFGTFIAESAVLLGQEAPPLASPPSWISSSLTDDICSKGWGRTLVPNLGVGTCPLIRGEASGRGPSLPSWTPALPEAPPLLIHDPSNADRCVAVGADVATLTNRLPPPTPTPLPPPPPPPPVALKWPGLYQSCQISEDWPPDSQAVQRGAVIVSLIGRYRMPMEVRRDGK